MRFMNCIDCPYPFVVDTAKGTVEEINENQQDQSDKVPVKIIDNSISVGHVVYPHQYMTPEAFQMWIYYIMKDQQTLIIPYKRENIINYPELVTQYIYDLDLVRSGYPGRNIIISRYSDTLVYFGHDDYNNNPEDHILIIPHGFKDIYHGILQIYGYRKPDYIYTIIERLFKGERETTRNWERAQQFVEGCIKQIESSIGGFDKIYTGEFVIYGWMRKFIDSKYLYSFKSHTPYTPPNINYSTIVQQGLANMPLDIRRNSILINRYINLIEHTRSALKKLHLMYLDATLDEGLKMQIIESMIDRLIMVRSQMQKYLDTEKELVRNIDHGV